MDDGQQVKRGGVTLCTDNYNKNEIKFLSEALKKNFNLDTTIHKKKSKRPEAYFLYERIYIKKESLESIMPSLVNYMHESMLYKINK